jgi:hypothetical protein
VVLVIGAVTSLQVTLMQVEVWEALLLGSPLFLTHTPHSTGVTETTALALHVHK